jgi:hypothetical protein
MPTTSLATLFLALAQLLPAPTAPGAQPRPAAPSSVGATAQPLDAGSTPLAPVGGAAPASANPAEPGYGAVTPLQPPPPVFARRNAPLCADFRPAPGGGAGWTAAASVQFPGPRGPVELTEGQIVQPGDYLQGLDLGSILQRDCPRTLPVPPPTG